VTLALEVVSDCCCDLTRFSYFSNRIAKFSNQIANQITVFQIKSFHLKSNHQNGSNRDLKPNRNWDLPITGGSCQLQLQSAVIVLTGYVPDTVIVHRTVYFMTGSS